MERDYTVYKITSSTGRMYIGYTSQTLPERWHGHKTRAASGYSPQHPFYCEIRKHGADSFVISALETGLTLHEALKLEKRYISECPADLRLNLSPGGCDDARFGGEIFWERLNKNPDEKEVYLKKLSDSAKQRAAQYDYVNMVKKAAEWREAHPVEAYKNQIRASRIARNKRGVAKEAKAETPEERKQRLRWRYKNSETRSNNVTQIWADRSDDEKQEIFGKISASLVDYMATLDEDTRRKNTEKARAAIDREKQGAAASKGIKRFWEDLKKDPVRYAEYMAKRTASLMRTLKGDTVCEPTT